MNTVTNCAGRFLPVLLSLFISVTIVLYPTDLYSQEKELSDDSDITNSSSSKITYSNPLVYNVDFSFELVPNPAKIDRVKDLKLWIPIPRDWDSQKGVKIISVQPPPHTEYEDPEHGNRMFFWDFGKEPEKSSYKVNITFRLESYEVLSEVDPEHVVPYDKTSKVYALYTRSSHTVSITPKIREMAQEAVGDEKNPYLQAKQIFEFVGKKMHYKNVRRERGSGVETILDFPNTDPETGEQYYEGACGQQSVLFVALCRAVGIPARGVTGMVGWNPYIKEKDLKLQSQIDYTKLTPDGFAAARIYGPMEGHIWAEFYLPDYGWIPVDPTWGRFGQQDNSRFIFSKGRDVKIGPNAPQEKSEGYGDQWIPIHKGRADAIGWGIWNIAKSGIAKAKVLHTVPFPIVKYFIYFLTTIILAIIVGGLAGFICFHKSKKYAFIGLANIVPFVSLALPLISVKTEEQQRCSKVRFVFSFWIFSIFLLWLYVFPLMAKTDLVSWGSWIILCTTVICILSALVSWILVDFLYKKFWIKNKTIRIIIKTILFIIFWIVSAYILAIWIVYPFG